MKTKFQRYLLNSMKITFGLMMLLIIATLIELICI